MASQSQSKSSDTSFRKTWDRDEYAAKASIRETAEREESKARYEAKLEGRKYNPRSTPIDAKESSSRASRLDVTQNLGKTTLVPAGSATGKRGRGAGQYCPDCDLTFKDSLQWVDHLNSRQHLDAVGESGEVKRATLEEVRARLAWLAEEKRKEKEGVDGVIDLEKRLEVRNEEEEKEREEKRRKRREKRRKTEGGRGIKEEEVEGNGIIC
ncbi:hypothetical protein G7Y79_00023g053970 [Physcia stellaris]|nr:hypothetical protein G7Y79_00023g053970 [Physcia stellaris]